MSDKKLFAIKEIEFRVNSVRELCGLGSLSPNEIPSVLDDIDSLLFDIQDFINDLKD